MTDTKPKNPFLQGIMMAFTISVIVSGLVSAGTFFATNNMEHAFQIGVPALIGSFLIALVFNLIFSRSPKSEQVPDDNTSPKV